MKRSRAIICLSAVIFILWIEGIVSGCIVQAAELIPVKVTLSKSELTVSEGETLTIISLMEQSVGIHSYQWYKDGSELEGQTEKILKIASVTLQDAGEYKLVITTTLGFESVEAESGVCTVTVSEAQEALDSQEGSGTEEAPESQENPGTEEAPNVQEPSGAQQGEASGSFEASDPSRVTASSEEASVEALSDSVNSGEKDVRGEDNLTEAAGSKGVLVVVLILILGMSAFGIAFFVDKSRSEYLEE